MYSWVEIFKVQLANQSQVLTIHPMGLIAGLVPDLLASSFACWKSRCKISWGKKPHKCKTSTKDGH